MILQSDSDGTSGDLSPEVGNEIQVTLDRWSLGQPGVGDLVTALLVLRTLMTNLSSGLLQQVRDALAAGDLVLTDDGLEDPKPLVRAAGVVRRWLIVRGFSWHELNIASGSRVVDESVRAVGACAGEGISLDGPQSMALDAGTRRIGPS